MEKLSKTIKNLIFRKYLIENVNNYVFKKIFNDIFIKDYYNINKNWIVKELNYTWILVGTQK